MSDSSAAAARPAAAPASGERMAVIGSNSFSGSHFVAHALRAGAAVVGISRSPEPVEAFLPYKWGSHDRFSFHALDLNHDLERILAVLDEFEPAQILCFAAQSMVGQSWLYPEQWFQTNVVSMVKLHDRLRTRDYLKRFVQISTPEVYGSTSGQVTEDAPFRPSTPYAVSKAACDLSLLAFHRAYGFPVVFTRAANVCGPGQQLYRIVPRTILSVLTGQKLKLEGGGTSTRSFIHIEDVCTGTLAVARHGRPGEAYHLATDQSVTIRGLVETICRHLNCAFADCVDLAPARRGLDAAYLLDCAKARDELGWVAQASLDRIVTETIAWARHHLEVLRRQPWDYVHQP
ncbi:MAG: NAD-dependent epimerase/dehydratase family protein [Verrucomicrobia bacterium]|nr:NAD-dependent epimerase/dehydratase family protein [Verrucomicrobiota bacterium]